MKHNHATGNASPACPACKKVINNYVFITNLAPLVEGAAASWLTLVARAYSDILNAYGVTPSFEGFTGCEQAQTLLGWIGGEAEPDDEVMKGWASVILAEIGEMAAGKMPKASE